MTKILTLVAAANIVCATAHAGLIGMPIHLKRAVETSDVAFRISLVTPCAMTDDYLAGPVLTCSI